MKERIAAAKLYAQMLGLLIERIDLKTTQSLRGVLGVIGKRVAAGEFKHLTMAAYEELLKVMAEVEGAR